MEDNVKYLATKNYLFNLRILSGNDMIQDFLSNNKNMTACTFRLSILGQLCCLLKQHIQDGRLSCHKSPVLISETNYYKFFVSKKNVQKGEM